MKIPALLAAFAGCALAQTPGIQEIMARVAESQAKSLDARRAYVYDQEELLRMTRPGGKLLREERLSYAVTPSNGGIHKELIKCEGKYESHGAFIRYSEPGYRYKNLDLDGEFMTDIEGSTGESRARDGISHDYFPLTAREQAKYDFYLEGTGGAPFTTSASSPSRVADTTSTWMSAVRTTMTMPRGRALSSSTRPNTSPSA